MLHVRGARVRHVCGGDGTCRHPTRRRQNSKRIIPTLQDPKPWPKPWTNLWPWWGALVGFSLGPRHHQGLVTKSNSRFLKNPAHARAHTHTHTHTHAHYSLGIPPSLAEARAPRAVKFNPPPRLATGHFSSTEERLLRPSRASLAKRRKYSARTYKCGRR